MRQVRQKVGVYVGALMALWPHGVSAQAVGGGTVYNGSSTAVGTGSQGVRQLEIPPSTPRWASMLVRPET